jgi:hypothetical protein
MHFEAFGHADLAAGQMMRLETLFRLYSQTRLGRSEKLRTETSNMACWELTPLQSCFRDFSVSVIHGVNPG